MAPSGTTGPHPDSDLGAVTVMEYLEGESFAAFLEREKSVATGKLMDLMLPVFAAVSAAHEEGITHRDLKPENIFLARTRTSQGGRIKFS